MNRQEPSIAGVAWALMLGIALGAWWGAFWWWLIVGAVCTAWYAQRRHRAAALAAMVALGAAWCVVRQDYTAADSVARHVGGESKLARVEGVVVSAPTFSAPWRGAMGRFTYQREPNTLAVLEVERAQREPASGRLLLRVRESDPRLGQGMRIAAIGWLSPVHQPLNPGELNYRQRLLDRGIVGQLSLATTDNWRHLGDTAARTFNTTRVGDAAESALNLGMSGDPVRLALLQTMLLGRWSGDLAGIDETFREVGLAHLLSISGAHLGILLGLVWLLCRLFLVRPPRAAMVVMAVLILFLLAVQPRVPIVRAGIMAVVLCATVWAGRRVDARHSLALAAIIVLLWRPGDLFSPGFQLSFLVVAALLGFTEPWLERVWPKGWVAGEQPTAAARVGRWVVAYAVVSAIAFCVALPVVAYHYRLISPLAIVLSLAALPVLTAMLAIGYAKILLGLISPSISLVLAWPLCWVSDAMMWLVRQVHGWPGATVRLSGEGNPAWSAGLLVLIWAIFAGRFEGRRAALSAACALMVGWTLWLNAPGREPAARVHALAVGDGSCFVVQRGGRTVMFDCGSQRYMDVGLRSVGPALQTLGVRRIDTLIVSHSDLDHYGGMLDVADAVSVSRVWVSPQLVAEAGEQPDGAVAFLLEGLEQRGVAVRIVSRGDGDEAVGRVLWPPADFVTDRANDSSIVLQLDAAGRRILLTGDIQQQAITRLLAAGDDLRADVADLSHHGSIVDATGDWLDAVGPGVVLQSCGRDRTRDEAWGVLLAGREVKRYVTARQGMVSVTIDHEGAITVDTFRDGP